MTPFGYFTDLDEVAAFGDYLVKVGAIPEDGFLHLKTKPVRLRANHLWVYMTRGRRSGQSDTVQHCFSHAARLADKFPDHYRAFKTFRRLAT